MSSRAQRGIWAGGVFVLALAGCGTGTPPEQVHDLTTTFPLAEVRAETGRIDFGTPAARPHLLAGWHGNERGRGGETFVWGRGAVSTLAFHLVAPRDLAATLRAAPLAGAPPQRVTVRANGRPTATLALAPGLHDVSFALPRRLLRAGENHLAFHSTPAARAAGGAHRDRRRLAIAWHDLRLRPLATPARPPRVEPAARTLFLPWGTEVAYAFDLAGDARLVFERVEIAGGRGWLSVAAQEEGGVEREVARSDAVQRGRALPLPGEGKRLLRVVFRALPGDGTPAGGLRLFAPEIRIAAASDTTEPAGPTAATPPSPAPTLAANRVSSPPSSPRPPDLFLYLIDALRADRLGAYGGRRGLTPRLDAFAAAALLCERAVAQAPWTRPAVATVFTGLGPLRHGVTTLADRLPAAAVTLAERLRAAGYRTAAFSTNAHLGEATGFAQGFDLFAELPRETTGDEVGRRALAWVDAQPPGAPVFVYLHALEPHAPYTPPADLRARFAPGVRPRAGTRAGVEAAYGARGAERARRVADLERLYDAEVAAADRAFDALLDALAARRRLDGALVALLADHGEAFDERGALGHAHDLHAEALRIPLIVKLPRQRGGRRVTAPAQQLDVAPTLLAAAGLGAAPELPGADLARLAAAGDAAPWRERPAFSHLSYEGRRGIAVTTGAWKLIQPLPVAAGRRQRLYDLAADPGERRDLADANPVRRAWLAALVRGELLAARGGLRPERAALDEEARRALAALGYL
jgi:arylsulfatase A-like enzyme